MAFGIDLCSSQSPVHCSEEKKCLSLSLVSQICNRINHICNSCVAHPGICPGKEGSHLVIITCLLKVGVTASISRAGARKKLLNIYFCVRHCVKTVLLYIFLCSPLNSSIIKYTPLLFLRFR